MSKPSSYLNWIPSGNLSYIQQPSSGQATTGWVYREAPPFQTMNWLFYFTDQWIQWFDFVTTSGAPSLAANSTVLATTGDVSSGSYQILNLASTTGLSIGNQISASPNVPSGAFIVSIVGSTVIMSVQATGTQVGQAINFVHTFANGATIQAQLDELDGEINYIQNTPQPYERSLPLGMTCAAGQALNWFGLTVQAGRTFTIAGLLVTGELIENGTIIETGEVIELF